MSIDIDELRRLHAETTQGEWKGDPFAIRANGIAVADTYLRYSSVALTEIKPNAKFIAAAHNQMPAILDEIERLRLERQNSWNRGHQVGTQGMRSALDDMSRTKSDYLDENERLTNMLLKAESEIEQLRGELNAIRARGNDGS